MRWLALLAVVLLAGSASAAAPAQDLTIQFRLHFTVQNAADGALDGTFKATGAVTGSGRVVEDYLLSLPRLRDRQPVETVNGVSTLSTAKGTLTAAYTGVVSSAAPTLTVTEGTWRIRAATGSFAGLHGSGRFSAVVDLAKRTMVRRFDGSVTHS